MIMIKANSYKLWSLVRCSYIFSVLPKSMSSIVALAPSTRIFLFWLSSLFMSTTVSVIRGRTLSANCYTIISKRRALNYSTYSYKLFVKSWLDTNAHLVFFQFVIQIDLQRWVALLKVMRQVAESFFKHREVVDEFCKTNPISCRL